MMETLEKMMDVCDRFIISIGIERENRCMVGFGSVCEE